MSTHAQLTVASARVRVTSREQTVSSMHAGTLFVLIVATKTFTFHDSRFLKAKRATPYMLPCGTRPRGISLAKGVAFVSAHRDEGHDGTPGI